MKNIKSPYSGLTVLFCTYNQINDICFCLWVDVSNCDILRLLIITYHDCENNDDYEVVTVHDNKLMQQVMLDYKKCVYIHA